MTILLLPVIGIVGLAAAEWMDQFKKFRFLRIISLYTRRALKVMI
jgi:hypothetical protein